MGRDYRDFSKRGCRLVRDIQKKRLSATPELRAMSTAFSALRKLKWTDLANTKAYNAFIYILV